MAPSALIIDDNLMNLETLALLVKKEGITPVTVQYVRDIPDVIERARDVSVVFLDIEFPNDSGFDILSELKSYQQLQDVPVVAYTVHTSEINEVREAGFDGCIGKPLSLEGFPDQLRRILQGEAVWEI